MMKNARPHARCPAACLAVLCCAVLLILPLAGCRPNDKAGVRGKVTLAGEPLDNVLVMFAPEAGPGAGGATNGRIVPAVLSVGYNPQFGNGERDVECFLCESERATERVRKLDERQERGGWRLF